MTDPATPQVADEDNGTPPPAAPTVVIVSGLSGSGKSVALKTFEDLDYYCVDNLPVDLLPSFVRSLVREDELPPKIAVGIDVRSRHNDLSKLAQWRAALSQLGLEGRLVFFDASDEVLLRRYSDTRRPLATLLPPPFWNLPAPGHGSPDSRPPKTRKRNRFLFADWRWEQLRFKFGKYHT